MSLATRIAVVVLFVKSIFGRPMVGPYGDFNIMKRVVGGIVRMFRKPESLFEQMIRSWVAAAQAKVDAYYNTKYDHGFRHLK